MNRKTILLAVSLAAAVLLLVKGKSLLDEKREQIRELPTPSTRTVWVSTVKGNEGVLRQTKSVLAEIQAKRSIALSTKLPGYVEKVTVQEAQKVRKGDLLVRIDAFELRSNIAALQKTLEAQKSDLALAKRIYERNGKLLAVGGISREKFTESKVMMEMKASALDNTEQKIAQLRHQLSYLEIRAPFDGVIDRIALHEGDLAVTGKTVLSMHDTGQKLIFTYTPAADFPIRKDQKVFYDRREIGRILSIHPTARNGLSVAEVALHSPLPLPIGSSLKVEVLTKEARGCILPDTTVVHKKEGTYVMAYRDGRFTPRKVTVLLSSGNRILLESCPPWPVASAGETKLSELPSYGKVKIIGETHDR